MNRGASGPVLPESLFDDLDVFFTHHFSHDRQTRLPTRFLEQAQRFDAESLKVVRRSARFVSAAAQHVCA